MIDPPRRRRADDDDGGRGIPLFPLILVVVFAGLLLGGLLAHFFGNKSTSKTPAASPSPTLAPFAAITPIVPARSPQPLPSLKASPSPAASATPSPKASVTPKATVTPKAAATASASPVPSASASAKPVPTKTPGVIIYTPQPKKTPIPATHGTPSTTAAPPTAAATSVPASSGTGTDVATGVVSGYLGALSRGDRSAAQNYLATGSPTETFMNSSAKIGSVRAESIGKGSYKATADVQTSSGEYFITFTLSPGPAGLQINDHFAIKTGP